MSGMLLVVGSEICYVPDKMRRGEVNIRMVFGICYSPFMALVLDM